MKRLAWPALAVAAAIALIYWTALGHSFLTGHDDLEYVSASVRDAFGSRILGAWAPVHILSTRLDRALWGEWAGGFVLGNLVLHLICALLVGALVQKLGGGQTAAVIAALVFAVHPVQVEAVAWIAQRKTLLCTAFVLGSLLAWKRDAYWLSLALGLLAMLSKPLAIVLPLLLIAFDGRRRLRAKVPFFAAALAIAILTIGGKSEIASTVSETGHDRTLLHGIAWYGGGPLANFFTAVTLLPRYLAMLVWPLNLSPVYTPRVHTSLDLEVIGSLLLIAVLIAVGWRLRNPFYWLFFLALLPVSQLLPQVTLMNDRYLYLPMAGAAALFGQALEKRLPVAVAALVASLAIGFFTPIAQRRVAVWTNDLTLWGDAIAKAPDSPHAWYNFGRAIEAARDDDDALKCYRKAFDLDDRDGDSAVNAGAILLRQSSLAAAEPFVEKGAALLPSSGEAQFNLGLLRFLQGKIAGAEGPLRASLANGAGCQAHVLLGHVLTLTARGNEALADYQQAGALGCADAEVALYRAYAQSESADEKAALATLAEAVPQAAKLGAGFLDRQTLKPLRAQARFDALLKSWAAVTARTAP